MKYLKKMETTKLGEIKEYEIYDDKQNCETLQWTGGQADGCHHNVGMHLACLDHELAKLAREDLRAVHTLSVPAYYQHTYFSF